MRSGETWKYLSDSFVICLLGVFQVLWSMGASFPKTTYAQVTTSITPTTEAGSLGTSVSTPINHVYRITGGTRVGTNLFHSFNSLSIGAGDTANFLNTAVNGSLPPTSNILGRVTGGNVSNIFGTIQTTGFENANLFLINPAGFLFGPNATVNVGGLVTFTSAEYIKLADGGRFNANPMTTPDILSVAPIAAFGFLGAKPGGIKVEGSQFSVTQGAGISLIGGDITISPGALMDETVQRPSSPLLAVMSTLSVSCHLGKYLPQPLNQLQRWPSAQLLYERGRWWMLAATLAVQFGYAVEVS